MKDYNLARRIMVDTQLRPDGITDRALLTAMGRIPREQFVPEDRRPIAYVDIDHEISSNGRALSRAAAFAKLVQLAGIQSTDIVLDVGSGTGYSAAVLADLASVVVGIEDDEALVVTANENLTKLDTGNAAILFASLDGGVPDEAPFDVIVLEGSVDIVPPALLNQLREGGRLVAMINAKGTAIAHVFVKSNGAIAERSDFSARVPDLNVEAKHVGFAL